MFYLSRDFEGRGVRSERDERMDLLHIVAITEKKLGSIISMYTCKSFNSIEKLLKSPHEIASLKFVKETSRIEYTSVLHLHLPLLLKENRSDEGMVVDLAVSVSACQ